MMRKEFECEQTSIVPICDIEIKNDLIKEDGSWDYEKSDIVTLGVYYGNKITILQREKEDKLEFWKDCLRKELEKMPVMYSFNINMEKLGIKGFLGLNLFFEEIKVFRGKGGSKENMFNDLVKNGIVQVEIPKDPLNGSEVQNAYAENRYEDIILHNYNCLIKEYFIFINRFGFLEKYKDKIKNGWWKGEKPFGEE